MTAFADFWEALCNFVRDVVSSIELGKSHVRNISPSPSRSCCSGCLHWLLLILVILCPVYLGYLVYLKWAAPRSTQNHVYRYRLPCGQAAAPGPYPSWKQWHPPWHIETWSTGMGATDVVPSFGRAAARALGQCQANCSLNQGTPNEELDQRFSIHHGYDRRNLANLFTWSISGLAFLFHFKQVIQILVVFWDGFNGLPLSPVQSLR